jgi:hypothetical protein
MPRRIKLRPSFDQRMKDLALETKRQAEQLRPGRERDALIKRARQLDVACHMNEWLSSPGLQPPTEITQFARADAPARRP